MTEAIASIGPSFGFGLYVHWPYCTRICPYCDFNVYAAKQRDTTPLVDAMLRDLKRQAGLLPHHPKLDSVFFGGGTPSLLSAEALSRLIDGAAALFGLAAECEITIEANPNDIARNDLAGWSGAGINRVSLGVQSFDDEALRFLGRDHDGVGAYAALETVQNHFENYSIDLIYALPGQTVLAWQEQLDAALALGVPHLSLYELTIKPATVFGHRAERGELSPVPEDDQAELYEHTQAICDAAGMTAYEISNHARTARFEAKHNHIYWASGDWIGLGPGAHGRITREGQRFATQAAAKPHDYMDASTPTRTLLTAEDAALEFLAMGLRPAAGLCLDRYEALFGHTLPAPARDALSQHGLIAVENNRLRLTQRGRLLADYVAGQLV